MNATPKRSMPRSPTVYLVEDEAVVAEALAFLLGSRGIESERFDSGESFWAVINTRPDWSTRPGCLLLDVRMRNMSGIEVFERLVRRFPALPVPVIFLTGHGDIPMAVDALKRGAFDFFEKPFADNRLVDRVEQALEESRGRIAAQQSSAKLSARLARLSGRERAVMRLILAGKLNKLIAAELGISMRTVEVHRSNVFTKMEVRNAVDLARLFEGSGLPPEEE